MEDNKEPWTPPLEIHKVKNLDLKEREFTANGNKYYILGEVTMERYQKMQELQIELGFAASYKEIYDGLGEIEQMLNEVRFVDAAVTINNLRRKTAGLEKRHHEIQKYCACFIVRDDEKITEFSEKVMDEKIADWNAEGINPDSFFALAVNTVRGLRDNWLSYIQDISSPTPTQSKT